MPQLLKLTQCCPQAQCDTIISRALFLLCSCHVVLARGAGGAFWREKNAGQLERRNPYGSQHCSIPPTHHNIEKLASTLPPALAARWVP
eukprot:scaffold10248_cov140-Skeletonema_menzelii.AAC.2